MDFSKLFFHISVRTLVWFVSLQVMVQFIYLLLRIRLKIKCHRWYPQLQIFLAQLPTNFYPNTSLRNGVSVKSRFPVVPDAFVLLVPTTIPFWQYVTTAVTTNLYMMNKKDNLFVKCTKCFWNPILKRWRAFEKNSVKLHNMEILNIIDIFLKNNEERGK